jgi:effector-binding domain-containing protein
MQIRTVDADPQPMVYVSRTATMDPGAIARVMGEAFAALGAFIGKNRIAPAGPPVAVYRMAEDGNVAIDVGFPVGKPALAKAAGEVKAGATPAGRAVKAVHHGPYDELHATYAEIGRYMNNAHLPMPKVSWEVYLTDPQTTPPGNLVTEVYFPLV